MLKYVNTTTGEESEIPDLLSTIDIFEKVYYETIPLEYDSVFISHLNKTSLLEIKVKESISEFRDDDYFYTKVDGQIALGRIHLDETYLIRTHDNSKSIFIHTLPGKLNPSKSEYYRMDSAEWRSWIELLIAEATSRITCNI